MRSFSYIYLCILVGIIHIYGCTKDIKEVTSSPGLDTIPFYQKNSSAFDTKTAVKSNEGEKQETNKEAVFIEDIKKRVDTQTFSLKIPDPWVPPVYIKPEKLPPALRGFPKDKYGYPDWVAAVKQGIIMPRGSILEGDPEVGGRASFNEDIIFEINDRLMANVLFPHKTHNFWLSCEVCHPKIFIDKKGANQFTMYDNWSGKFCGRCHGKVSFIPKGFDNCQRCHKMKKKTMGPR